MSAALSASPQRAAFEPNWPRRLGFLALAIYVAYAMSTLDFTYERFVRGLTQGAIFLGRLWPPNFAPDKLALMREGLVESVQIAILATAIGIILSIPIGLISARNLVPVWLSWIGRIIIAVARSFHPMIVAILFVKARRFPARSPHSRPDRLVDRLHRQAAGGSDRGDEHEAGGGRPGDGRLLDERADHGRRAACHRAFVGFSAYQLDSNLRNSTMVGIVGGGGIGRHPVHRLPALRL